MELIIQQGTGRSILVKDTTTGQIGLIIGVNDNEQDAVTWANKKLEELKNITTPQYIIEVRQ